VFDPGPRRNRHEGVTEKHERKTARKRPRIPLEIVEELATALVLVDASDVNRERSLDSMIAAEPLRNGTLGDF
jgi:hypothetical protein